jgi:hypothetical protein
MPATRGMAPINNYAGGLNPVTGVAMTTDPLRVAGLLALIPNPDLGVGSNGAISGAGRANSYLDEMSPACAAQLIVEITAMAASIT